MLIVSALLFFMIGAFIGRVSMRWHPGSLSIVGPLPRRAQLELDGRPFAIPIGTPAPVKAGQHTLSIVQPRGNRQDFTFQVRPNEHIVIMSPTRRPGVENEEAP
jgi:serine/threonine-protein kinase